MTKEVNSKYRRLRIRSNINNRNQRTKTKLATHIWSLKDARPPVPYTIKWKIIDKGKPFNPVTGVCRLCLKEKYHILYNRQDCSLNRRDELFGHCPHKRDHTTSFTRSKKELLEQLVLLKRFHFHLIPAIISTQFMLTFCHKIENKSQYPMSPLG